MTDAPPLLARLAALFAADPLIDEIGLLFDVAEEDLTPDTAFQYAEHKLGVAFCAGVPLFRQARTRFHELSPALGELRGRNAYAAGDERAAIAELLQCSRAILLISADFYTAWNTRKALVDLGYLDALDEIRFTNLVFTLHPKSIDTWAYRRWLAIRLIDAMASDEACERFLDEQIAVCERLAEQKPRNYHAWSFRHWVVTRFATVDELRGELRRMDKWCETHITDHSGWNHRQHTVNQLLRRSSSDEASLVLKGEYELLSGVMALYPTHEALWCHRRFIIHLLLCHHDSQEVSNCEEVTAVCQQIKDVENRVVAEVPAPTEPSSSVNGLESNGTGSAVLREAWQAIQLDLFGSAAKHDAGLVASVCVREMEIAWRCESKFARRYAVWCLARLRVWTRASREISDALDSLSTMCKRVLAVEDETLRDLWVSDAMAAGDHF